MTKKEVLGMIVLVADEGKVLKHEDTYAPVVYLGKEDDGKDWTEIDESEVPKEDTDDELHDIQQMQ